jgi:hypothetical protein
MQSAAAVNVLYLTLIIQKLTTAVTLVYMTLLIYQLATAVLSFT